MNINLPLKNPVLTNLIASKHFLRLVFNVVCIFSSPEHEVLMVSYCGQWLSVVRRRASCVVHRASSVVRQHLMFTL